MERQPSEIFLVSKTLTLRTRSQRLKDAKDSRIDNIVSVPADLCKSPPSRSYDDPNDKVVKVQKKSYRSDVLHKSTEARKAADTANELHSTTPGSKENRISSSHLHVPSVLKHHSSLQSKCEKNVPSESLSGSARCSFTNNDRTHSFLTPLLPSMSENHLDEDYTRIYARKRFSSDGLDRNAGEIAQKDVASMYRRTR